MEAFLNMAAEWWVKWAFGLLGTAILAGFKYLRRKQKEQEAKQKAQEERQRALEDGMKAILRDRIVQAYYHYHGRGDITLHGLENVKGMYDAYTALGGNGIVKKLHAELVEMEVVDD